MVLEYSLIIEKQTRERLARWCDHLLSFNYLIEHISCIENIWADPMTRWVSSSESLNSIVASVPFQIPVNVLRWKRLKKVRLNLQVLIIDFVCCVSSRIPTKPRFSPSKQPQPSLRVCLHLQFYFLHRSTVTSCPRCHHLFQAACCKAVMCLIKRQLLFYKNLGGPGWLSGCTLLLNKVQSAGSNSRKVNGFFIPDSHLSENSDYGSYDGAERRKRFN